MEREKCGKMGGDIPASGTALEYVHPAPDLYSLSLLLSLPALSLSLHFHQEGIL
jgi:hypothetical protein